ncbi:MAG: transporter substrate-binding domain-containing protein [Eubacteriales bacterium]|nr:transporter substrate-binding domain-containing protein [Eubacteriales bacterium]
MKMKKLFTAVLAAAMVVSMTGCGSAAAPAESTAAAESTVSAESTAAEESTASADTAEATTEAASTEAGSEAADASADTYDLAGKKIGVQLGTTGDQLATEYEQNGATVERYNKGADAIQALKQGKIDCVVIDGNPAKAFVEKNDDLKILDGELSSEEYAMCVKKGNTELADKINGALQQLEEDGTLDAIVSNYIGDEVGQHPYTSPEGVDRSNGTLVMATNAAFEPYEYYENQEIVGIDPDIAQAVCDVLGYELKIEDMEFDSIINAVVSGKADFGAAGMTVTEDRKLSVDFTDTYATASQVIIVKK